VGVPDGTVDGSLDHRDPLGEDREVRRNADVDPPEGRDGDCCLRVEMQGVLESAGVVDEGHVHVDPMVVVGMDEARTATVYVEECFRHCCLVVP
jgi:hypothetical protein